MSRFVDLHRESTGIRESLNAVKHNIKLCLYREEKNIYE